MDSVKELAKQIAGYIKGKKTRAFDTAAEVKRIVGDTAYVHIPGGVPETPVKLTIDAKVGDKVQVRVANSTAWLTGNRTAPPTDDEEAFVAKAVATTADTKATTALEDATRAQRAADTAEAYAQDAKQTTDEINAYAITAGKTVTQILNDGETAGAAAAQAKASAENASEYAARALGNLSTVQNVTETLTWITAHGTMALTTDVTLDPTHVYFVIDPAGDYTVGGITYAIVTEPDADDLSSYYELSIDESLNNYVATHLAVDSEGLWLLPATSGTNKVLIATGAGSTYTTAGTYLIDGSGNIAASFRADGATINAQGVNIAHLGYGLSGGIGGSGNYPYYTFGKRDTTTSAYDSSHTYYRGNVCVYDDKLYVCIGTTTGVWDSTKWKLAYGGYSVSEGTSGIACGYSSHSEGDGEAFGFQSHAEGSSVASGSGSHSEGHNSYAEGIYSHSENRGNANGDSSHAEGYGIANGDVSHAEGSGVANGDNSHAQNTGTKTDYNNQTAIGKYNDNKSTNLFEIGNGTSSNARSNAFEVDDLGNVTATGSIWADGDIECDGSVRCNGDISTGGDITATGNIVADGAVEDTAGNVLADKITAPASPSANDYLVYDGNDWIAQAGGGGSKNVWYATCSAAAGTAAKVVATDTGDFTLSTGNMLRVVFTNGNTASSPTLKVDSVATSPAIRVVTGTSGAQYQWQAGETVDFVYNGTYFLMVNRATATTTYYGPTKLSSSTSSTSTTLAATASAVKSAYDLANTANTAVTGGGLSSSLFVKETVQLFASTSIAANNHTYSTLNITKSGYYPLAIAGWNSPDMRYFVPARLRLSAQSAGSGTISYDIYNAHSSAHSGSFSADVLWLKVNA